VLDHTIAWESANLFPVIGVVSCRIDSPREGNMRGHPLPVTGYAPPKSDGADLHDAALHDATSHASALHGAVL
jgi:hypothetical protein